MLSSERLAIGQVEQAPRRYPGPAGAGAGPACSPAGARPGSVERELGHRRRRARGPARSSNQWRAPGAEAAVREGAWRRRARSAVGVRSRYCWRMVALRSGRAEDARDVGRTAAAGRRRRTARPDSRTPVGARERRSSLDAALGSASSSVERVVAARLDRVVDGARGDRGRDGAISSDEGDQLVTTSAGRHGQQMPRRVRGQTTLETGKIERRSSFGSVQRSGS